MCILAILLKKGNFNIYVILETIDTPNVMNHRSNTSFNQTTTKQPPYPLKPIAYKETKYTLPVKESFTLVVVVYGSCGVWELLCLGVSVCGSFGEWKLRCVRELQCVWELRCVGEW